jgi:acetyltransferase-like isoleucine patch superfamily enzyme
VPGLYANWLRLWGARLGPLIFWSPGCSIFDRQLVEIGGQTVIGAGVKLVPHVIVREADGVTRLLLAPIRIGQGTLIGGFSVLTAGNEVGAGEMTPATYALPPFAAWHDGKRLRGR